MRQRAVAGVRAVWLHLRKRDREELLLLGGMLFLLARALGLGEDDGSDTVQVTVPYVIGRPIGGRIRKWWESDQGHEPQIDFN